MPRNRSNLKMQLHEQIDNLLKIGKSKHAAKKEYREYCLKNNIKINPAKAFGIHSIKTAEAYRQTANNFGEWLKSNHSEIKYLEEITSEIAYEYLKQRENQGNSAWTVSKDMSAINKCLDLGLNKKDGDLAERSYKNITRSRLNDREYKKHCNEDNYEDQILIAKAFGVRRESIHGGKYQVKDTSLYEKDGDVFIRVIEKGGRYRESVCLDTYKQAVLDTFEVEEGEPMSREEFIDNYNNSGNVLFDKYTRNIDNHSFRSEYAYELYKQIEIENGRSHELYEKVMGYEKVSEEVEPREKYRGYDKETILKISSELGHNRPSIVVEHYLGPMVENMMYDADLDLV